MDTLRDSVFESLVETFLEWIIIDIVIRTISRKLTAYIVLLMIIWSKYSNDIFIYTYMYFHFKDLKVRKDIYISCIFILYFSVFYCFKLLRD